MGSRAPSPRRSPLPHREQLERAFGESLADVQVHTGAGRELEAIGAEAATFGNQIAFASHAPDLRTTAHEVAHVIQNRRADGPVPPGIGPPDGAAEVDAQAAATAVDHGGTPDVQAAPGGELQLGRIKDARRRLRGGQQPVPVAVPQGPFHLGGTTGNGWQMSDRDLDPTVAPVKGTGGSLNRVDRVTYKHGVGTTREKLGFFKPLGPMVDGERQGYDERMANRAIASTRLDSLLGFNILPTEFMATHGGEVGTVSPKVSGSPVYETRFDIAVDTKGVDAATFMKGKPNIYKQVGDEVKKMSGVDVAWHDYTNPVTQRGLSDLQLLDAIVGQMDRHGGNIYIDDRTGQVRGIDNDRIFDDKFTDVSTPYDFYVGLPAQVSKSTAERVLAVDPDTLMGDLAREMRYAGATELRERDQAAIVKRLTKVKAHLQKLKDAGRLVPDDAWGEDTYRAAMAEVGADGGFGRVSERNYLKRSKEHYDQALVGARDDDRALPNPNAHPVQRPRFVPRHISPKSTTQALLRKQRQGATGIV